MLRQLLMSSSVVALAIAGVLPVQAQTPPPSSPVPETQQAPGTQAAEVSDEELQSFVSAVSQLQTIQQEAETAMTAAVQTEGLSPERFIAIAQAQRNPEAQPDGEISEAELQTFNRAIAEASEIQANAQTRMEQAVQAEGLTVQRFNQIFAVVRQNPELLQEVRQRLNN